MSESSRNQPKASSGTDSDIDILRSPSSQRNIDTSIQPTGYATGFSGESLKMDSEQTTVPSKSPPACKSLRSTAENIPGIQTTEDIRNITTDLYKTKLSSDQSYPKLSNSNLLSPEKKKDVSMKPTSVTMKTTDRVPSTVGSSGSITLIPNPSVKPKTDKGVSINGQSQSKASVPNPLEFPPTEQKSSETFELADACRFILNLMESKETALKYQEGQLDICSTNIQKALRDAKQVCFKLEHELGTIDEEMSAAITKSQKLACLLSIAYRCFRKLEEFETNLQESLQTYPSEAEIFHESVDGLVDNIIGIVFEKSRQLRTL